MIYKLIIYFLYSPCPENTNNLNCYGHNGAASNLCSATEEKAELTMNGAVWLPSRQGKPAEGS